MKEYDATEAAYKNGYKNGVRELFEEIEKSAITCEHGEFIVIESWVFEEMKKKYLYRCSECRHFVGCECFSGKSCDKFEP